MPAVGQPVLTASAPNNLQAEEDRRLLEEVAAKAPAMRDTYESNLRTVNAYIRDAQASVETDPTDEDAQQSLMDAYEQKAMVYEMAMDRSLP